MPIALAERISLLFPAKIFLRRTHLDFALEDFFSKQPTDFGGQTSKRDTTILLPRGKLRANWEGKHTFTHAHCCSWGGKKSFSSFSTPFCYPCTGKIVKYSPQYTLFHKKKTRKIRKNRATTTGRDRTWDLGVPLRENAASQLTAGAHQMTILCHGQTVSGHGLLVLAQKGTLRQRGSGTDHQGGDQAERMRAREGGERTLKSLTVS